MPYAQGRTFHDADSHIMERPDWIVLYADPGIRDRLRPLYVATVKPGEENFIDTWQRRHADPAERLDGRRTAGVRRGFAREL